MRRLPHRLAVLVIGVLALTGALAGPVTSVHAATTLFVATTGTDSPTCGPQTSPCKTMTQAVTNAAPGDTISVAAGTYPECVTISRNLTIQGAGAMSTFVDGGNGGSAGRGSTSGRVFVIGGTATVTLSSLTIEHGKTSGRSAEGGGVFNSGTATLTNVTLSGNSASGTLEEGGGILNGGNLTLQASIIANSPSGGDCANFGTLTSNGSNIIDDTSCNLSGPGDLNNANPLLGPLANNGGEEETQALLPGSPAIDHVALGVCPPPATDERGVTRPQGPACDSGAFEVATSQAPSRRAARRTWR